MIDQVISFPRGDLTSLFFNYLQISLLFGDGVAPDIGGWSDDPNLSTSFYSPYGVLMPLTTGEASGSIAESNAYVISPYSLTYYGISREQIELMSDRGREVASNLGRTGHVLNGLNQSSTWKIMQARCSSIGGISRTDNVEPSLYSQTDVISIYISKEFT